MEYPKVIDSALSKGKIYDGNVEYVYCQIIMSGFEDAAARKFNLPYNYGMFFCGMWKLFCF